MENNVRLVRPWDIAPYRLVSWWDMEKFGASSFYGLMKYIADIRNAAVEQIASGDVTPTLKPETVKGMKQYAIAIRQSCSELGLKVSAKVANRIVWLVGQEPLDAKAYHATMEHLERDIKYEMEDKLFFYIPGARSEFYDQKELFGATVNAKFPSIQFDMVEAGNCYAMGRGTACVFHLMRIMEVGVQQFGTKLSVTFTDAKNWHNILEETDKAIKLLPSKGPDTVKMSQASANLYAVKLAWRNEVMHPNDTYTLEEAENLIRQVKLFMGQLASII